jgi:hypothetical protein
MQMVKIHIPDQNQRAKALLELIRRGRVICVPNDVFVVPEPALDVLRSLGVTFQEMGRGGIDYAEKALRDSLAAPA